MGNQMTLSDAVHLYVTFGYEFCIEDGEVVGASIVLNDGTEFVLPEGMVGV